MQGRRGRKTQSHPVCAGPCRLTRQTPASRACLRRPRPPSISDFVNARLFPQLRRSSLPRCQWGPHTTFFRACVHACRDRPSGRRHAPGLHPRRYRVWALQRDGNRTRKPSLRDDLQEQTDDFFYSLSLFPIQSSGICILSKHPNTSNHNEIPADLPPTVSLFTAFCSLLAIVLSSLSFSPHNR